jgi:spore germination protein KC
MMKKVCSIFIFLSFFILSGCWDQYELEERANILGLAIDLVEQEDIKEENEVTHPEGEFPNEKRHTFYKITAQIAVPGKIKLGPEGGSEGSDKTSWVIQTTGHTLKDAMANLQQQLAERLYLGHLQIVIISDEIAERGIEDVNDYLGRNPEVRRTAWMVVNKKDASKVIQAAPPLETVPSLYLSDTLDNAVKFGKLPREYLGRFWIDLSDKGIDGILPAVKVVDNDRIMVDGFALFRGEKMVDRTTPIEIGVLMNLTESNAGGYSTPVEVQDGIYFIESQERTNNIDVTLKDGEPTANISVKIDAILDEQINTDSLNDEVINEIEKEANKKMEKLSQKLVASLQDTGSDALGIGARIRAKHGGYWDKEIQSDEKWIDVFQEMDISITYHYRIRRAGIRSQ